MHLLVLSFYFSNLSPFVKFTIMGLEIGANFSASVNCTTAVTVCKPPVRIVARCRASEILAINPPGKEVDLIKTGPF